jgi:predicted DNA binding CopG/RHH family protein
VVDRKENTYMKIPKFKTEREEADWLYAHRKAIEREIAREIQETGAKPLTVAEIVAREQTKAINIRLAVGDIEQAKVKAKARGIGYQTLLRMMIHDSLRS